MAKWDLSKLPEGRKPLPDEWFRDRAHMQERIKKLETENKRLKSLVADVIHSTGDDPEIMAASRAEWAARALAAEAKLAKAVEALEKLDVGEGWAAQIARTTLAELTGGKDE